MSLPDFSLFQQFSEIEQTLKKIQHQNIEIKNELDELKKLNKVEEEKCFKDLEEMIKTEKNTEIIQKKILILQEKESELELNIHGAIELAFHEYISVGKYKEFIDNVIILLQKEYGNVVISCSENTSSLVSTYNEIIPETNKIRLLVLNGSIEYILDPLLVQKQIVDKLLVETFNC